MRSRQNSVYSELTKSASLDFRRAEKLLEAGGYVIGKPYTSIGGLSKTYSLYMRGCDTAFGYVFETREEGGTETAIFARVNGEKMAEGAPTVRDAAIAVIAHNESHGT